MDILGRLTEKVQRKTKRTPPADAGECAYCLDCILQQSGWIFVLEHLTI